MFRKFSQWFDAPPAGKASHDAGERPCTHSDCPDRGIYRAPKSRHHLESGVDDWYWFCLVHVRDYNARWNYYANMPEDRIEQERRADITWQRPSWPLGWPLGAFPNPRGGAGRGGAHSGQPFQDPFGLFNEAPSSSRAFFQSGFSPRSPEGKALAVLGLSCPFSSSDLRKRYRTLVKKHHPDANGGSLEAEEALKRINEAYEVLKGICS